MTHLNSSTLTTYRPFNISCFTSSHLEHTRSRNMQRLMPANMSNNTGNDIDNSTVRSNYFTEPLTLKVTMVAVQAMVALFGVIGNLLVCIVITKRASMKTTMNLYLRSLAVADLGVLLVIFPLQMNNIYSSSFGLGKIFCQYIFPATEILFGASIWSITVIAIERYRNIISRRSFGKRAESFIKVNVKIVFVWLVSFVVVAVPMYPFMTYIENENSTSCYPIWPEFMNGFILKSYVAIMVVFWYLLPLAIIVYTYSQISSKLKQSTIFHKGMHGVESEKSKIIKQEEKQRLKQNKKAKRILTPLVLVFAISMLPFNLFRLAVAFHHAFIYDYYFLLYLNICSLFVVINSAVDPIVYYISSKEFRKVLQPMLNCSPRNSCDDSSQTRSTQATNGRGQREDLLAHTHI